MRYCVQKGTLPASKNVPSLRSPCLSCGDAFSGNPDHPWGVGSAGHSRREMTCNVVFASGIADLEFNDPFHVILPVVLVDTMELEKGEVFEWLVEDKNTLVLRRTKPKPMRESRG